MQRYRNDEDLDEYEDDLEDQYEDDDEDQYENEEDEEEEEKKEEPLSQEAIKYLQDRERKKAKLRSILRSENGKNGANINHLKLSNFGSFFGPSQPVIADRVIQESKSLLETRHLAPKVSISQNDVKKVRAPSTSTSTISTTSSKNRQSNKPPPRQAKSQVQAMKVTRDYSFLLSDDTDVPKPAKDPGPQRSLVPKPGREDARSAQVRAKRYEPSSHPGKKGYDGFEQRKPSSEHSQAPNARNAPPQRPVSGNRASLPSDSRRQLDLRKPSQASMPAGRSTGSGSRPSVPKVLPQKKPLSSSDRKMPSGSIERKSPVGIRASDIVKTSTLDRQRLPLVKQQASGVNNRLEHKRDVQRSSERKILKDNVSTSRSQMANPPRQSSLQPKLQNGHHINKQKPAAQLQKVKKRKALDPDLDGMDYRSAIREMFGYRPAQYHDDDDVSDMEAGFGEILEEERRSARIAKKEDDEEFIKIQEEERREAMRKKAKMRRMNGR